MVTKSHEPPGSYCGCGGVCLGVQGISLYSGTAQFVSRSSRRSQS